MSLVLGNACCAVALVAVLPSIGQRAMRSVTPRHSRLSAISIVHMLGAVRFFCLDAVLNHVGSLPLCGPARGAGIAVGSARDPATLIASRSKGAIEMWLRGRILPALLTVLPRPS